MKKARCCLVNRDPWGRFPLVTSFTLPARRSALRRAEQTKPPGIASTYPEAGQLPEVGRQAARLHRPQLVTESSPPRVRRARAMSPCRSSSRSSVSRKNDLPDLGLERDPSRGRDGGPLVAVGTRELELDGVGALEDRQQVAQLVRSRGLGSRCSVRSPGHILSCAPRGATPYSLAVGPGRRLPHRG